MTEPTIRQLRTLLTVAVTGAVSVAARRLGIAQPATAELERALGLLAGNGLADPVLPGLLLAAPI